MKKCISVFIVFLAISCNSTWIKNFNLNGIWIPETINWQDGNFETFYFYNDTSFILLSSTQKLINDSIFFQAEPGFILRQGTININTIKPEIRYHVLYRFITLPGDTTPSKLINESLFLSAQKREIGYFEYEGAKYIRTNKYTNHSENFLKSLATKMVPDLKKEFRIN